MFAIAEHFATNFTIRNEPCPKSELWCRKHLTQPYTNTIFGDVFAINKAKFEGLGYLDEKIMTPSLSYLEFSLRWWRRDNFIHKTPCSRVGRIVLPLQNKKDELKIFKSLMDRKKVIDLWFDYYYKFSVYIDFPMLNFLPNYAPSYWSTTRSFKWYLTTTKMTGIILHHNWKIMNKMFILSYNIEYGNVKSVALDNKCLDAKGLAVHNEIKVDNCTSFNDNQIFRINDLNKMIVNEFCLILKLVDNYYVPITEDFTSTVFKCQLAVWTYKADTQQLMHMDYFECLSVNKKGELKFTVCNETDKFQRWIFDKTIYYSTFLWLWNGINVLIMNVFINNV